MAPSLIITQPYRKLYKFFRFLILGARIPIWLLKFTFIPSSRPDPRWTLRQTLMSRLGREVLEILSVTETPQELSLKPGKEGDTFKVIEPAEDKFYKGPLLSKEVLPTTIGGTWFPKPIDKLSDLGPDAHVILHIHGGGFVQGDGRTDDAGFFAKTILKHSGIFTAVFCPQYRLSCRPTSAPFPAALQDALTSYLYLVGTLGVPAAQIAVSGDSAGGNIAVAFLRYLADFGAELGIPSPGTAVLISPWVAPAAYVGPDDARIAKDPHYATDYIPASFPRWGARAYAGTATSVADPYITALGHPFRTSGVPVFVSVASGELLEAEITPWVAEMSAVDDNDVEVYYEEGAPHDTLLAGFILGWKESAEGVAAKIGEFVRERTLKRKGLEE